MRYKQFIILFSFVTIVIATSCNQSGPTSMAKIQQAFQEINNDTTLTKLELNADDFLNESLDGGGQLTGYYKATTLEKIVTSIGLSDGNEVSEFYFRNDQLFFVFSQFQYFAYDEKREEMRYDTTVTTFEGRYYFINNKLAQQVIKGHDRMAENNKNPASILLNEAQDYQKILAKYTHK